MRIKQAFLLSSIILAVTLVAGIVGTAQDYWKYGWEYQRTIIIEGQSTIETVNLSMNIVANIFLALLFALQVQGFFVAEDLERKPA